MFIFLFLTTSMNPLLLLSLCHCKPTLVFGFCHFRSWSVTLLCPQKHIHYVLWYFLLFFYFLRVLFDFCWVFFYFYCGLLLSFFLSSSVFNLSGSLYFSLNKCNHLKSALWIYLVNLSDIKIYSISVRNVQKMRNQRGGKLFHSIEFYIAQLNDINRFKV